MAVIEHACGDAAAAIAALSELLEQRLADGLRRDGKVGLIVSGGRTPRAVLTALRQLPLDWSRIVLAASDERHVPVDHPDSTEAMVRESMPGVRYLAPAPELDLEASRAVWAERLRAFPWPAAASFLGIGDDAHTASLFPERPEVMEAGTEPLSVPATPPHAWPRLTLPVGRLLDTDCIAMIIAGPAKKAAYRQAQAIASQGGDLRRAPVAALMRQSPPPFHTFIAP